MLNSEKVKSQKDEIKQILKGQGVPVMVQQKRTQLISMKMWVQSLASLGGLQALRLGGGGEEKFFWSPGLATV